MARRRWLGPLALSVVVAALVALLAPAHVSSAGAEQGAPPTEGTLFLHVRGTADRQEGTPPDRFVYVVDVYDTSDTKIGTVTHDVAFTSPTTLDLVSTFHLPDGELVNRGVEVIAPDSAAPGFYLIGVHADRDTVVADKGTGAYAGRTGRLRMSGWHDANTFPQTVTLNDFYAIELNP